MFTTQSFGQVLWGGNGKAIGEGEMPSRWRHRSLPSSVPLTRPVTLRGQDTAVEIPGHEGGEEAAPAPQRWRQTAPGGRGGRTPTSRLPSEASTPTGPGEGGREHPRVHARPSACGSLLRRPTWTSADCVSPRTGAPGEARPAAVPTCRARGGGPG